MIERNILIELENYGWVLAQDNPFEYGPKFSCIWVNFEHQAFPRVHVNIEIKFNGLSSVNCLTVSDDNCDGAGDSRDICTQIDFNMQEIWNACEDLMEKRRLRGVIDW
jgi:hypothetical protein